MIGLDAFRRWAHPEVAALEGGPPADGPGGEPPANAPGGAPPGGFAEGVGKKGWQDPGANIMLRNGPVIKYM